MTRLRSAAQRAPQTKDQATELLARYSAAAAQIAALEAQRQASTAAVNAAADACVVPLAAELKDIAKQLKPWWAASIDELTGGKRKSIELGGCQIGYRLSPPKVVFDLGKDADAMAALVGTGWEDELLRVAMSLKKTAILDRLQGELHDDLVPLELLGFRADQAEEFFIDVLGRTAETGLLVEAA